VLPEGASSRFVDLLRSASDDDRPALIEGGHVLTHEELWGRAAVRAQELGLRRRSLVVLSGPNSLEFVVTYLALLRDGHVPLLAGSSPDRLVDAWQPDAIVTTDRHGCCVEHRNGRSRNLHADLALLLSTSGSTGSPKLVRLSQRNLAANAAAIIDYLGLTADDRAITALPLHYCYGLSVLHSHLLVGASVVVTDTSVVDPCFAAALDGVTNVAGVPHTFELLEHVGPERIGVPSLRLVTVAGGRMSPDRVVEWADRAKSWGADLYVMYGQTEATARMAYLPPHLVHRRPEAIGVAVPGGGFELAHVDGVSPDVGELIYRGPNVMLGYAVTDDDLADGATLDSLHTGDLARYHADDGVYEVVGRRARFVKPFGLRIDLDALEAELGGGCDVEVAVGGDDDRLVVVAPGASADVIRQQVAGRAGLPEALVVVDTVGPIPRNERGKVDYETLRRAEAVLDLGDRVATSAAAPCGGSPVAASFAAVLGCTDVTPTSTFVSLGGDSMSYVECAVRLEGILGRLPADWHLRTVAELDAPTTPRRLRRLDTTAIVRAFGICVIVSTHMGLWFFPGGAHLMLAVVGYNLSRFQLTISDTGDRLRAGLRMVGRIVVPVVGWVAVTMFLVGGYSIFTLLLVNNYLGPPTHQQGRWHFWFIEVIVQVLLVTVLVLAIPVVRRAERRWPYAFAIAVLLVCLALRWAPLGTERNLRFQTHSVAFFFALGWLIHQSKAIWQRLLTSALCIVTIPGALGIAGYFGSVQREWFVALGLIFLIWVRAVPVPGFVLRPVAVIAAASLWILITHFKLFPPLRRAFEDHWAYVLTIAGGVLVWLVAEQVTRLARRTWRPLRAGVRPFRPDRSTHTGRSPLPGPLRPAAAVPSLGRDAA
jgi:acyl-CoA synthetase (AMP-forming)/AMP-acid ligase II